MEIPPVIIHVFLGFSITNHPAIGDPPFMETSRCFLTRWRPWGSHHKAFNPEIPWETNHKNMGHIGVNHGLGLYITLW